VGDADWWEVLWGVVTGEVGVGVGDVGATSTEEGLEEEFPRSRRGADGEGDPR